MRNKIDITRDEYDRFYKAISKDSLEPMTYSHFSAEGDIMFKSILFIPAEAQRDQMGQNEEKKSQLSLYVRRVLISEKMEDLLPKYLAFFKGIIDSDDVPLNVNREALQQLKMMKIIGKKLTRKALELIKTLSDSEDRKEKDTEGESDDDDDDDDDKKDKKDKKEKQKPKVELSEEEKKKQEEEKTKQEKEEKLNKDRYATFWKQYGSYLKMGLMDDSANRQKIAKLLRF